MTQENQNYYEITLPVLQRKCQELFNTVLLLETNLHVEMSKTRQLTEELVKTKTSLEQLQTGDFKILKDALEQANSRIAQLDASNCEARAQLASLKSIPVTNITPPPAPKIKPSKIKVPAANPKDDF